NDFACATASPARNARPTVVAAEILRMMRPFMAIPPSGSTSPFGPGPLLVEPDMTARRSCPHSALMLAARITLPHFSASSDMNFPKSEIDDEINFRDFHARGVEGTTLADQDRTNMLLRKSCKGRFEIAIGPGIYNKSAAPADRLV